MFGIYIDGDACPVKDEVYRVAVRHELCVTVVSNMRMRLPDHDWLELVVVDDDIDAADDWIAEHVAKSDIVITGDIPLAARCLQNGARVLGLKGREFTGASIGSALATREILSSMRDSGVMTGGPAPFAKKDRSRFLERLENAVQASLRDG